jgi:hypothetical protein
MCKACLEELTYPWFAFGVESLMKTFFSFSVFGLVVPLLGVNGLGLTQLHV